jgi:membrane-associated phospholipid phosphatase
LIVSRRSNVTLAIVAWLAAIAFAALFDRSIAIWLRDSGAAEWIRSHKALAEILKAPGDYYFTIVLAIIVAIAHPLRWRAGGFVLLATMISGINGLTKWIVGRTRPFKLPLYDAAGEPLAGPFNFSPFRDGLHGLFQGRNLCFPSGHAALAFATAAALAMLWPKSPWRWLGFAVASLVAAERVAENAHWLSDAVGAAALGIGCVYLIHYVVTKVFHVENQDDDRRAASLAGHPLL